eukprot:1904940-Rhodomonas_salina.1
MILLGIQLQQILWQVARCLMYYCLSVHSVYIDDEGAAKKMVSVDSEDFQLRAEFFSREDVHLNLQVYNLILAPTKPSLFKGETVHDGLFKTSFTLKAFQLKTLQDTHPLRLLLKVGEGNGQQLRILVEEATG